MKSKFQQFVELDPIKFKSPAEKGKKRLYLDEESDSLVLIDENLNETPIGSTPLTLRNVTAALGGGETDRIAASVMPTIFLDESPTSYVDQTLPSHILIEFTGTLAEYGQLRLPRKEDGPLTPQWEFYSPASPNLLVEVNCVESAGDLLWEILGYVNDALVYEAIKITAFVNHPAGVTGWSESSGTGQPTITLNITEGEAGMMASVFGGAEVHFCVDTNTWEGPFIKRDTPNIVVPVAASFRILRKMDSGKILRFTNTSAKTLEIPSVSVSFNANTLFTIRNSAAGDLTIEPENVSVTILKATGADVVPPYSTAQLLYIGNNIWEIL